ncbi:hypothetical protein J6590_001618 [Homalodisca vitripennis]|nr:hypothetical protein J6590_001618 [Homalodisca vitripennis]
MADIPLPKILTFQGRNRSDEGEFVSKGAVPYARNIATLECSPNHREHNTARQGTDTRAHTADCRLSESESDDCTTADRSRLAQRRHPTCTRSGVPLGLGTLQSRNRSRWMKTARVCRVQVVTPDTHCRAVTLIVSTAKITAVAVIASSCTFLSTLLYQGHYRRTFSLTDHLFYSLLGETRPLC